MTMEETIANAYIRREFQSILNILIHFSFSITELISVFAILGLQIALSVTQACPYHLAIGYWSFPFLLLSPCSVWLLIWRRTAATCVIAILLHFCSTLFATAVIIVSFLVLIGPVGLTCPKSSLNEFHGVLNGSLIGMAAFFKLFNYGEILLLYLLMRNRNAVSKSYINEILGRDDVSVIDPIQINIWRSWSATPSETRSRTNSDCFLA